MKAVVFGELTAEAKRRLFAASIGWSAETVAFLSDKESRSLATRKEWLDCNRLSRSH
jgi:hypothetical protein